MKRYIYNDLLLWKTSSNRKPLMIYGARQVGKTYIVKEFGKNEFQNLVYINCYKNKALKEIFGEGINMRRILTQLSALTNEEIIPQKTLLFFDEVQEIPEIVGCLKYFYEDIPDYAVITAGSLLGVMDLGDISFPTGKVNMLHMYPMTFIEFLEALNEDKKVEFLFKDDTSEIRSLSDEYENLLREYYYVGGMPEAVKDYVDNKNPLSVRDIQKEILNAYYSDIAKHAGKQTTRCHQIFETIPSQLAKENKKFIFGAIKKGARASEYELAIQWLIDAGLVYKIKRISKVAIPLSFYFSNEGFKLYLLDVGLLGALAEVSPSMAMTGKGLISEFKGAFTENYVLSQLVTMFSQKEIAYFSKENSKVEIDFVVQAKDRIFPIEVKAEDNVKSKSLRQFITIDNEEKNLKGVRFSMKGFIDQGWMVNIPLWGIIPFLRFPN